MNYWLVPSRFKKTNLLNTPIINLSIEISLIYTQERLWMNAYLQYMNEVRFNWIIEFLCTHSKCILVHNWIDIELIFHILAHILTVLLLHLVLTYINMASYQMNKTCEHFSELNSPENIRADNWNVLHIM